MATYTASRRPAVPLRAPTGRRGARGEFGESQEHLNSPVREVGVPRSSRDRSGYLRQEQRGRHGRCSHNRWLHPYRSEIAHVNEDERAPGRRASSAAGHTGSWWTKVQLAGRAAGPSQAVRMTRVRSPAPGSPMGSGPSSNGWARRFFTSHAPSLPIPLNVAEDRGQRLTQLVGPRRGELAQGGNPADGRPSPQAGPG